MVVRRLPPPYKSQKLVDLYVTTLKVNFHDEPAKYYKFFSLLNDYKARRINLSNLKPRVEEIMKDHPKLLLGLSVFFPKDSVYLPEARVSPSPGLTMEDASLYMDSVEEAFYEEPAKYDEFLKILLTAHSADEANAIAKKLEELMKDHQNLLKGFSVFRHPSRVCCAS